HGARSHPSPGALLRPEACGPNGVQGWVGCVITRTRLWDRPVRRVPLAPSCFPGCADPFHDNEHSKPSALSASCEPRARSPDALLSSAGVAEAVARFVADVGMHQPSPQ